MSSTSPLPVDPIRLEIFKHIFVSIAEEMGVVLRKSSYSPNIKERRDYSCALFDSQGRMVAQAAHIPVHLGSMPLSVLAAIEKFTDLRPGDAVVLNDPFRGGTHLPDLTLVSPVYLPSLKKSNRSEPGKPFGYVACRAHHADVGGMTPGSMPIARELFQEGLIIPPVRLVKAGKIDSGLLDVILANVRTPQERLGDIYAQVASNQRGVTRLQEITSQYGPGEITEYMGNLLAYSEKLTRELLQRFPDGVYTYLDYLDDDGVGDSPVPIQVEITVHGDRATVDFSGSAPQQKGGINAVYAITLSAVQYVFRSLLGMDAPNNAGCMVPVKVIAPPGSVVNALHPAAVAGGNVETSQRIVDVLLGALAQASPESIPAASQGTMNNLTIGGFDPRKTTSFAYYETIAGGMGARPDSDGPSAVHSHMTNTLNTPVEALEFAYPLRVLCYQIRDGSGGGGQHRGGDGIRRDIQVQVDSQANLLTERRRIPPYGLQGGDPGSIGENYLIRDGEETRLPGKGTFELREGDILSMRTPGGGGYGAE